MNEPSGLERPKLSLADRVRSLKLQDMERPTRQGGSSWVPWTLCLLLAGACTYLGYQVFTQSTRGDNEAQKDTDPSKADAISSGTTASSGDVAHESKGYIVAAHLHLVSPKVGGMVVKLNIKEEGQRFKKDEILAELEKTDYAADNARAEAAVEGARQKHLELQRGNRPEEIRQAEATLREAEESRNQLRDEVAKLRRSGSAVSKDEMDKVESRLRQAEQRVEQQKAITKIMTDGARQERIHAAEFDLKLAEAELTKAKWRLDNCTIRAPISGTILSRKAEEGNMVNPSAFSNGLSASVCEMADLSDLEVDLNIQERDIAKVFKNQKCKVRVEAFPERSYEGVVSRLMPIADRSKGAVPVRVKITVPKDEEGKFLRPEMGASVFFMRAEIQIPANTARSTE